MAVDEARLDVYRELLKDRLAALQNKMGSRIGQLVDQRESLSDQSDIATEESDRDMELRLNDHERRMVNEIQQALRRVDHGDYGVCVACGDDISERRLLARPMATHCIDCMTELEAATTARM